MSADNFNHVRRFGDEWRVWLNLSASCELEPQLAEREPDHAFDNLTAAIEWADEQGYTEYGTHSDDAEEGTGDEGRAR